MIFCQGLHLIIAFHSLFLKASSIFVWIWIHFKEFGNVLYWIPSWSSDILCDRGYLLPILQLQTPFLSAMGQPKSFSTTGSSMTSLVIFSSLRACSSGGLRGSSSLRFFSSTYGSLGCSCWLACSGMLSYCRIGELSCCVSVSLSQVSDLGYIRKSILLPWCITCSSGCALSVW